MDVCSRDRARYYLLVAVATENPWYQQSHLLDYCQYT